MFLSVRSRRRWLRLILAFVAVIGAILVIVAVARGATADRHSLEHRADELRERAADARSREQELGAEVAAQSAAIDSVEARVAARAADVAAVEAEHDRARAALARVERNLATTARSLDFARRQYAVAQNRLSARLVAIYTSDEPELVEILVGASSLEELLDRVEAQERIVAQDERLAAQIDALGTRLARERARLTALRRRQAAETETIARAVAARRAALAAIVAERDRLVALRADRRRTLAAVSVDRRQWEAQADALEAQSAAVAAVATAPPPAATAPTAPTGEPATPVAPSAGFVWPVRGSVVSPFGQRWGRLHAGIDIAAPAGTPIVASASGRVAYAGSMSGYGLIVVIQHANNVATAYAHNSRINVSVGQTVTQGQTIAAVGCTGSCYGDHVHFEVRVGGSPVDPMGYL